MNPIRKLIGQTAVYGLSTILARTANYLVLTPLYTYVFTNQEDFGINTEIYAYISFLNIILTYGMETAFFNFYSKQENKQSIYSTALISLLISTSVILITGTIFSNTISSLMGYEGRENFIVWMFLIICSDALMVIPFARLRSENKAARFAMIKTLNILINIICNVFFIIICKNQHEVNPDSFLGKLYDPSIGIGYGFLSNVIANIFTLLLLINDFTGISYTFDKELWRKMIIYASPLIIVGFAGMINETFDRIILAKMLPESIARREVGIYGACYKLSIVMTIFIQAFRFAAEPFFFNNAQNKESQSTNALVTKYFVLFCSFIFLGTMMNISWLKYFVSEPYWEGISVVPILLIANLFLGVFYNLSIWYKLTDKTKFGALLTIIGASITIIINFIFIPAFSYVASAWATLISYGTMMIVSYLLGKKYYPVKYNLRSMSFFFLIALGFYFLSLTYKSKLPEDLHFLEIIFNNLLLILFALLVFKLEIVKLLNKKKNETKI